jgi:hypothetical protein
MVSRAPNCGASSARLPELCAVVGSLPVVGPVGGRGSGIGLKVSMQIPDWLTLALLFMQPAAWARPETCTDSASRNAMATVRYRDGQFISSRALLRRPMMKSPGLERRVEKLLLNFAQISA